MQLITKQIKSQSICWFDIASPKSTSYN